MSRPFIVVGDTLDHGGSVVSGSNETDIDGKAVARVGDRVICSEHGQTTIVSGDSSLIIDGSPVARHGDRTACGGTLLSSQSLVFVDDGGGHQSSANASNVAAAAAAAAAAAGAFDQALRFVGSDGSGLANVNYTLTLANGETHKGVTDESGTTARVATETEQPIVKAELSPGEQGVPCCSKQAVASESVSIDLTGISTTNVELGSSVKQVKTKAHERPLTSNEIAMARQVFGDAVDYSQVKVHNHGYWMFFGFQNSQTAVTPNGEMYMPKEIYEDDYSVTPINRALFMHEMTHVWQYQLGYTVKLHGLTVTSQGEDAYKYNINPNDRLCNFNMEQQGNIISDYYMIVIRGDEFNAMGSRGTVEQLRSVLTDFLKNPRSKGNLPE